MNGTTHHPAVLAEGLRYRYGEFEAVRGIDLNAPPGELLAVLGTNGAGKTTTLEILQGIRRGQGTVRVLGLDPYQHRRRLAGRVGVMFQESALPDELAPLELLNTWRQLSGDPAHRLAETSLETVGLDHRADLRIGQLSGGERRRLELAVALSTDPEILFLDEPTAGLDPESRTASWRLIHDLLRRGTTIVLTTHYLHEAEALADRIAILHRGRVEVSGTLEEVVASRRSRIRCNIPSAPALPGEAFEGDVTVTPNAEGKRLEVRTHRLARDLKTLLDWSHQHAAPLHRLNASEASLEEVFHSIVHPDPGEEVSA